MSLIVVNKFYDQILFDKLKFQLSGSGLSDRRFVL